MRNVNYLAAGVWLLTAIIFLFIILSYGHKQYENGYRKGKEEMQKQYQESLAKHQRVAQQASQNYEKQKAENEVKRDERQAQVTKIIRVPVYTNVCLDASGVRLVNEAISSR